MGEGIEGLFIGARNHKQIDAITIHANPLCEGALVKSHGQQDISGSSIARLNRALVVKYEQSCYGTLPRAL